MKNFIIVGLFVLACTLYLVWLWAYLQADNARLDQADTAPKWSQLQTQNPQKTIHMGELEK